VKINKITLTLAATVLAFFLSACSTWRILPELKATDADLVYMGSDNNWDWQIRMTAAGDDTNKFTFRITGTPLEPCYFGGEAFRQDDGSFLFHADNFEWFSNWADGYTRATFSTWGTWKFDGKSSLEVLDPVVVDTVKTGMLRYGSKKMYGDQSRDLIQRRWSRVQVAADFLNQNWAGSDMSCQVIPEYKAKKPKHRENDFLHLAGQLLFPEKYGYGEGSKESTEKVRAEGILWDTAYTGIIFSEIEELKDIRNSGTLYRDWEEGSTLLYIAYHLKYITGLSLINTEFKLYK